jgi:polyphosphate glucokinase
MNTKPSADPSDRAFSADSPRTLAIDVGGTALKASVLDDAGQMLVKRVRVATPYPCRPKILLSAIAELTAPLVPFDRVSIGFPGVIGDGRVITAPHFDQDAWRDFPLEAAVADRFGKPARLLNDAEIQGLGIVAGRGLEVVLTLGTGLGSAVFSNGELAPHLELAQHPVGKGKTYNDYIGNEARLTHGQKKWNRRVLKVIGIVNSLLHYDMLYLGGGNAAHITTVLPHNVHVASNDNGMTGGIRLWDGAVWDTVEDRRTPTGDAAMTSGRPAHASSRRSSAPSPADTGVSP